MNHFSFGTYYRFTLFGGSHEPLIGVEVEGLPAGLSLDREALQHFLDKRAPGRDPFASPRREADVPLWEEGLTGDVFTGKRLRAVLKNQDPRPGDYEAMRHIPRPGHADYPAYVRYGAIPSGGGHFSARLTAAFCIAGGIAKQLLAREGIRVEARVAAIGGVPAEDEAAVEAALSQAAIAGDSLGGVISCQVRGLPVGLGDHPFGGLENRLAQAVFGIPGAKGLEFGDGFDLAAMRGSQANDSYRMEGGGVTLQSNHGGGILGGMSNGAPLLFRVAFKPPSSIPLPQDSVDLAKGENTSLQIRGRHDICYVPRALPVVESAAAVALYDALLEYQAHQTVDLPSLRQRIDAADRELSAAFRQRMEAVDLIGAKKKARGSAVTDPAREADVLDKVLRRWDHESPGQEHGGAAGYDQELKALYETIFELSKKRQG